MAARWTTAPVWTISPRSPFRFSGGGSSEFAPTRRRDSHCPPPTIGPGPQRSPLLARRCSTPAGDGASGRGWSCVRWFAISWTGDTTPVPTPAGSSRRAARRASRPSCSSDRHAGSVAMIGAVQTRDLFLPVLVDGPKNEIDFFFKPIAAVLRLRRPHVIEQRQARHLPNELQELGLPVLECVPHRLEHKASHFGRLPVRRLLAYEGVPPEYPVSGQADDEQRQGHPEVAVLGPHRILRFLL